MAIDDIRFEKDETAAHTANKEISGYNSQNLHELTGSASEMLATKNCTSIGVAATSAVSPLK